MFTGKLAKLLIVVSIITIAIVTVSFALPPAVDQSYSDYAQRHPAEPLIPATGNEDSSSMDYYQRHAQDLIAARPVDTTDYFFRHPQALGGSASEPDLSDYYLRHSGN